MTEPSARSSAPPSASSATPPRARVLDLDVLDFTKGGGLVTVVAQDARSGAVLMVAHADREALERTLATGEMHYRSRTRGLWHKGATSGNVQRVVRLTMDCDGDAVLAQVVPAGPACHTGAVSCFGGAALAADTLGALDATIEARAGALEAAAREAAAREAAAREPVARGGPPNEHDTSAIAASHHPASAARTESMPPPTPPARPSYTQRLLGDRNLRLKKLGEETAELVTACADGDRERATEEAADLVYHVLVALRSLGARLADVRAVLEGRARG